MSDHKPGGSPPGVEGPAAPSPEALIGGLLLAFVLFGAAGVFVLTSIGWMLLFLAACCGLGAGILMKGLTRDG